MLMDKSIKPIDRQTEGDRCPVHQFAMTGSQVRGNELPSDVPVVWGSKFKIPLKRGSALKNHTENDHRQ